MNKYTNLHSENDQYPVIKIHQVRRSYTQPIFNAHLPQSRSVRSTLGSVTCDFLRGERPLSHLSMTSGCYHLLPKLTIGKGLKTIEFVFQSWICVSSLIRIHNVLSPLCSQGYCRHNYFCLRVIFTLRIVCENFHHTKINWCLQK